MQNELNTNKKERDPFFDNARFVLVALVVLGHLVSPASQQSDILYFANNFLSSFRMPALILITGYLSKRFYKDKEKFIKKITIGVLIPYLIFQSFYSLMNDILYDHDEFMINLLSPSLAMWFLLSLFFWNVMLFFFTGLKHPIVIAFIVGIGVGWLDNAGHYLSVSRTFVFFPFFLIGHYLKAEHLELLKKGKARIVSLISIAASWSILSFFSLYEARTFLLGRSPYIEIADSYLEGAAIRLVIYVVMLLGILSFLPWMPRHHTIFTHLGSKTAYIYILHIFFIKLIDLFILPSNEIQTWYFIAIPVIWLAITFFVSSKQVTFFTKPLIEGSIANPLFKEDSPKDKKREKQTS